MKTCDKPTQPARHGFTLVELLVVIAIIGVLVALLLPAVQAAREAARRTQCLSNLKQVSLALLNYESSHGSFPAAFEYDPKYDPATLTKFGPNWVIRILPFMEQQVIHDQIDFTVDISDPNNAEVLTAKISSMLCPSDPYNQEELEFKVGKGTKGAFLRWGRGNYAANAGNGPLIGGGGSTAGIYINGADSPGWKKGWIRGVMGPNVSSSLKEVVDGTSNTIMVGEVRAGLTTLDRRGTWALGQAGASSLFWYGGSTGSDANGPNACNDSADDVAGCRIEDLDLMRQECMPCFTGSEQNDQATVRSAHPGGVNLGMTDGSSHFVSDDVDLEDSGSMPDSVGSVWDFLISAADEQVIEEMPF